jgi:putative intracellular protease/amidase
MVVPFLVEDELLRLGAIYEKMANWQPFSVADGRLITGQNPASSTSAAQALLKLMTVSIRHPRRLTRLLATHSTTSDTFTL